MFTNTKPVTEFDESMVQVVHGDFDISQFIAV